MAPGRSEQAPIAAAERPQAAGARYGSSLAVSAFEPGKSCGPQAIRVALTKFGRRNNSLSDAFANHFRLAGVIKPLAGSLERFGHRRNYLRFECSGL
jgi:hypothetical protein